MPTTDPKKRKEIQKRADEKRRGTRSASWNVIVYPESAPADWRDVLDAEHIKWCESPLHDKDVNPTGEPKKAHWHVLLTFPSMKTVEQVKELVEPLKCPIPIKCNSVEGSVRYMAHIDNPEKYQYDKADVVGHNGFDVAKYFEMTASQKNAAIDEMTVWCVENNVTEFADLKWYALNHNPVWNEALHGSCYEIINILKSFRHSGRVVDIETGQAVNGISADQ